MFFCKEAYTYCIITLMGSGGQGQHVHNDYASVSEILQQVIFLCWCIEKGSLEHFYFFSKMGFKGPPGGVNP